MLLAILLALSPPAAAHRPSGELPPAERLGAYAERMRLAVERPTVAEAIGPIETPLTIEMSGFFMDHPDLASWLVRKRKVAPYVITMTGPNLSYADDGDGTTGFIALADRTDGRRSYYTEGTHVSRVLPDIRAAAVVVLDIRPVEKPGCRPRVLSTFEVYVRMRSAFLSTAIKALRPFIQGVLIRKFTRAFGVAQQVGILMRKDPAGMAADILSYPGLSEADREKARVLLATLAPEPAECLAELEKRR